MKWIKTWAALGALVASVGCSESAPTPERTHSEPIEASPPSTAAADPEFDPARERATKENWQEKHSAQTQIADIDWESADRAAVLSARLSDTSRETLRRARVPVLLPDEPELLDSATFTSQAHWYAAAMESDGVSVYVSGTRREFIAPNIDDRRVEAERPRVTRNDLISSMTFKRFGAMYVVEVECARPSEDARCQEDDFIRDLTESLRRAGGLR